MLFLRLLVKRWWATLSHGGRLHIAQPWAVALGPLLLVLALLAPYRALFFLAYVFLLVEAAAYGWAVFVGRRIVLARQRQGEWAQVGDELAETWTLRNGAWLPVLWLEVEEGSTLPGYSGRRVISARPREQITWSTSTICRRRGVFQLGPLLARTGDPLGMFVYTWREPEVRKVVVYPPLLRLPPLLLPNGQRGGLARADLLQQYATPSVGGLRPYAPGDMLSRIHWPTVARTNQLMVKEFDQERAGALWIVLDLHAAAYAALNTPAATAPGTTFADAARLYGAAAVAHDGSGQSSVVHDDTVSAAPDTPLELAVALACSLAAQALAEGRAVGMLADDGRRIVVSPGHGTRQLWRILGALVDVQGQGDVALGPLVRQETGSTLVGAALALVTPALDAAWVPALAAWQRARATGALALLVAPDQATGQPLAHQLATFGVAAQVFVPNEPLPLVQPPRRRSTIRVSPLGKAVREP